MSTTLEDRVILLLREQSGDVVRIDYDGEEPGRPLLGGHGFWERLAERTGVLSRRWRKVYAREQKVTSDMLQAMARLFPSYAFWLVTGITDAINGHVAPATAQTFPERLHVDSPESSAYFRASIELEDRLFREGRVNAEDDAERLYAAERTRPLAHWHDSPLAEVAYRLADTPEYAGLQHLWERREAERAARGRRVAGKDRTGARRRSEAGAPGVQSTVLGVDVRTAHQDAWDLFYVPAGRMPGSRKR
ncbi:hypothetical protein [Paraburkholderia tropica]|uniref:hypothetical protein n=1 Tax=Paraburkholderia tropica TaxID=92647 RepID=UPI002AB00653|nr:hypothetical protein [Paraburkholderia tropica]